jgi:hypothetical protein
MSRQKAISVKIATTKVIKALEAKLVEIETAYKKQDENEAKYQKAFAKWQKEVVKFALDNISKGENVRTNYRQWNNILNVDFDIKCDEKDFPKQPERDFETFHSHSYKSMKDEIENAIRILKMTDEEVVSTSTYNAIAQYL